MTEFMLRVAAVAADNGVDLPAVGVVDAPRRSVPSAADRYVSFRALAEQLVSEANSALGPQAAELVLEDDPADGYLSFTLRAGDAATTVATQIAGAVAVASFTGIDGRPHETELAGREDLEALVLALVREAARARSDRRRQGEAAMTTLNNQGKPTTT